MITVCSIFRDAAGYVDRYFAQIERLREHVPVRLVLAEGDSTDGTAVALKGHLGPDDTLITVDHHGPKYPSVDLKARWDQIAIVVRATVREVGDPDGPFVWVEGDLRWLPATMLGLTADLSRVPAVAPMAMAADRPRFYDVWGYRKDGVKFTPYPPYYQGGWDPDLVKIDSCGSCFAVRPDHWHTVQRWDGVWPFTANGNLWLDPTVLTVHP